MSDKSNSTWFNIFFPKIGEQYILYMVYIRYISIFMYSPKQVCNLSLAFGLIKMVQKKIDPLPFALGPRVHSHREQLCPCLGKPEQDESRIRNTTCWWFGT